MTRTIVQAKQHRKQHLHIDSALGLSLWSPHTHTQSRCWGCLEQNSCCPRPQTVLWTTHTKRWNNIKHFYRTRIALLSMIVQTRNTLEMILTITKTFMRRFLTVFGPNISLCTWQFSTRLTVQVIHLSTLFVYVSRYVRDCMHEFDVCSKCAPVW